MENTMKKLLSLLIVAVMVFGMIVPATPLHVHATEEVTDQVAFGKEVADAAAQMVFPTAAEVKDAEDKYFIADCPACGAKNANWQARGEGSGYIFGEALSNDINAAAGRHYYLVGDARRVDAGTANGKVCIHLNGHDIINTGTDKYGNAVVAGGTTVLNIMGQGTVAGNRTDGDTPAKTGNIYGSAQVNLFGGTYTHADPAADESVFGAWTSATVPGWSLNLFAGAEIVGANTAVAWGGSAVDLSSGTLNVLGGRISGTKGGSGAENAQLIRMNGAGARLNIYAGEIVATAGTKPDIVATSGVVTIAGNPVVGKLRMSGATLNIGELTAGASIGYSQTTAATNPVAVGKGDYAGKYIHAYLEGGSMIKAKNGNLTYCQPILGATNDAPNAYCAYCDEVVAWVSFSLGYTLKGANAHQYLGRAYTTSDNLKVKYEANSAACACLHMNGQTLTNSSNAIQISGEAVAGATLNIMGKGSIIGSRDEGGGNDIINSYGTGVVTINLNGVLKKNSGVKTTPAFFMDYEILNIGDGGAIDLTGSTAKAARMTADTAQLNIKGGKIIVAASGNAAIEIRKGTFNLESGEIRTGGKWSIYNDHDGDTVGTGIVNISGGKVTTADTTDGGVYTKDGTTTITGGTFAGNPSTRAANNVAAANVLANADGTYTIKCAEHVMGEATCYTAATCVICGYTEEALVHDYSEGACANCGKTQCQVEGHTCDIIAEAVEATCTTTGMTSGWNCTRCEEVFVEQEELSVKPHDYVNVGDFCSVCGAEKKCEEHTWEESKQNEKEATYESAASYDLVKTCSACGATETETVTVGARKTYGHENLVTYTEDGKRMAWCEACQEFVQWTGLNADSIYLSGTSGGAHPHIMLWKDVVKEGDYIMQTGSLTEVCVNLNGYKLSSTDGGAILVTDGDTLNILGSGEVSGNRPHDYTGNIRVASGATLNLYGGTYKGMESDAPVYLFEVKENATLRLYEGAVVSDPNATSSKVTAYGNAGGTYEIHGANVDGIISATSGQTVIVSGAPKIRQITLSSKNPEAMITIGDLTEGAEIGITRAGGLVGPITAADENIESYAKYFTSTNVELHLRNVDNALTLEKHTLEEGEYTVEPDCLNPGKQILKCTVCLDEQEVDVDSLGHLAPEGIHPCTDVFTCVRCEEVIAEAPGHDASIVEFENEFPATCKNRAYYDSVTYCSVCHEEVNRIRVYTTDEVGDHVRTTVKVENELVTSCILCGEELERETINIAPEEPAEEIVAEYNSEQMGLNAALEAAAVNGGTVKLIANATAGKVTIWKGVKLDLNGKTLTADYISANFATSEIIDSGNKSSGRGNYAKGDGKLIVPEDCLFLDETNEYMVVRLAENTFGFAPLALRAKASTFQTSNTDASFDFDFFGHSSSVYTNQTFFQSLLKVEGNSAKLGVQMRIVIKGSKADGTTAQYIFSVPEERMIFLANNWSTKSINVSAVGLGALAEYRVYPEFVFIGANGTTVSAHEDEYRITHVREAE